MQWSFGDTPEMPSVLMNVVIDNLAVVLDGRHRILWGAAVAR